jgi:hypothetical protein
MKRLTWIATAALVAAALPAQAQQAVGVASAVQNDVRLRKPGGPIPRPVALRQRIALADQIQTGAKSQLQMLLLDKSIFTVGPNARLTIDHYVYDPDHNSRSMGATVTRGAFRFMSGRRTSGGSSTISTPVAAIGVRGTIVEGVVGENAVLIGLNEPAIGHRIQGDPETASLIVLRGPGRGTQGNVAPGAIDVTAGGRTVTADRPMQAIYVPYEGAAPIGPFVISNSGLSQLQAVLFPALAERLGLQPPVDPNRTYAPPTDWVRPGDNDPRSPLPRRPFPGQDLNGPPPTYNPQLPYGSVPNLQGPGPRQGPAPQQQAPQNQRQSPAAAAPDPAVKQAAPDPRQAAPNNAAPPKDSLAPPNLKAGPDVAGPPPVQVDPAQQAPPNQKPNDPGKGKGKPQDPPKPGPQ